MCGIAGYAGSFQSGILSDMIRTISHRGPDDTGIWVCPDRQVGFAHSRLSIIDLSANGHQPMANEDDSVWLTYNGEIYNYLQLRAELKAKGHIFRSRTDSEVLLHLYEEFGVEMLGRLNGIFAFGLWDGRKRTLFLARDAIGVKPLYYSETVSGFLFASELKSLLVVDEVPRDIDIEAVYQYVTYLWAPAPRTMLKDVKKLPPGSAVIVSDGRISKLWRWYVLPYDGSHLNYPESEISRLFSEKVEQAVGRQLISDVPVGAFLSGGLDSSTVVAMMRRCAPESAINCYCIDFENEADVEDTPLDLPYARKVAKHLDVNLHKIIIRPEQLIERLEEMIYYLDEPQADPAPVNAMFIAERAREDGIKVLLSGSGGDDIIAGYRRHAALLYEKYWQWFPFVVKKFIANSALKYGDERYAWIRRFKKVFAYADKSPEQRLVSYFKWSTDESRWNILSRQLRNELKEVCVESPLLDSLNEIPMEREALNRMLYLDTRHFLADHNLNYVDKTAMRYGVEVRVPLLDIDLVEFAARIPVSMKQYGRTGKYILKKAMEPYLLPEVIHRRKTGFGAPLRKWIRKDMEGMMSELLSEESLRSRGLCDPSGVKLLIEKNKQGRVDGAYTLFSLMCIEMWCRIFLDKTTYTAQNFATSIKPVDSLDRINRN
jgi:asparagine synthase (glutamine-hydrolysing)